MRKDPTLSPPEVKPKAGVITQLRHYKIITPLYGGGVEPAQADPVTIVRGAEIRGQLRFWWRATRGGQFGGDLVAMKQAEEAIWGSPAAAGKPGPSKLSIHVVKTSGGKIDRPFEVVSGKGGSPKVQPRKDSVVPPYAAFPLQPSQDKAEVGMDTKGVLVGVEFWMDIHFSDSLREDVEAALWAWETFGGVGARTRRGFGALQLVSLHENGRMKHIDVPKCSEVDDWIYQNLKHYAVGHWHPYVPHLGVDMHIKTIGSYKTATDAWRTLIDDLQSFRQWRHKKFGLSLWPEANYIRKRFGKSLKWPPNVSRPALIEKFPRGKFGLPIIFHMPHDKGLLPTDSFTLQGRPVQGKTTDRLSSPLLLRPFACRHGSVGLAAILDAPKIPPEGLEVAGFPSGKNTVSADLTPQDARTEPLNQILNGEPDVLKAFLDYLE